MRNAANAVLRRNFPDIIPPAPTQTTPAVASSTSSSAVPSTPLTGSKTTPPVLDTTDVFGPPLASASSKESQSGAQKAKRAATPKKKNDVNCPICDGPFHLRHLCPIVKAGAESIEKRMNELKGNGADKEVIEGLQASLKKLQTKKTPAKKTSEKVVSSASAVTNASQSSASNPTVAPDLGESISISTSRNVSQRSKPSALPPVVVGRLISQTTIDIPSPLSAPLSAAPVIPAGSVISEVTVESQGEGSSDEDDSESESDVPLAPQPKTRRQAAVKPTSKVSKPVDTNDLEALLHGPPRSSQSILAAIGSDDEDDERDNNGYMDDDEDA